MKRKILIVEDNVGLSQIQKDWLSQAGYEAVTADTQNAVRPYIVGRAVAGRRRHFPVGMAAQGEEGHPVHHNDRIRFRPGRCAHHQTGSQGLPA